MHAWWVFALLAMTALAGCTADTSPEALPEPEDEVFETQLEKPLVATKTTGVIRGIVVDAAVTPIAGVQVWIQGTALKMNSTAAGAFGWDDIDPGTYVIEADHTGYLPQQTIVQVAADQDRPPVVKLVMSADAEEAPYVTPYSFNGFMDCGTPAVEPCSAPNQIGHASGIGDVTQDATVFNLELDRAPDWIQSELAWTGSQPLADFFTFCFQHPGETNSPPDPDPADPVGTAINTAAWLLFDSGASAQWLACRTAKSPVVVQMDHNRSIEAELGAKGVQLQVYGGHAEDIPDPTGFGLNTLIGLQLQQDFEVFAHAFYNQLPPAGWVFVNDGSP